MLALTSRQLDSAVYGLHAGIASWRLGHFLAWQDIKQHYRRCTPGPRRFIADYNPFTHMIALVREPLLGDTPSLTDWLVVLAIAVVGWIGTFLFSARFPARIVYRL
jgi:ABC-type polysaccharide/polyol phosphate export permease